LPNSRKKPEVILMESENFSDKESGIKVSVSGAKAENAMTKDLIAAEIRRNIERWGKFSGITSLSINIKRADDGGKVRYTVRAEATGNGSYHADAEDWNLEPAMHETLDRLSKELVKKKEKTEGKGRFSRIFKKNPFKK
jgi:hypothetical protein